MVNRWVYYIQGPNGTEFPVVWDSKYDSPLERIRENIANEKGYLKLELQELVDDNWIVTETVLPDKMMEVFDGEIK